MTNRDDILPFPVIEIAGAMDVHNRRDELERTIAAGLESSGCQVVRINDGITADAFAALAAMACGTLVEDNGEHERVASSHGLFTPTAYAPDAKLLWHNENTFLDVFPSRIAFGCSRPADLGGETPLADGTALVRMLDPGILKRFREHGICYVRTYVDGFHRTWKQILRATDRTQAERYCAAHHIAFAWRDSTLTTRSTRPALIQHPRLGCEALIAQPLHWHPRALDDEVRDFLVQSFGPEAIPRNCYYGDGTVIEDSVIDEIKAACQEIEQTFRWRPGDVMLVDNLRQAHARNPYTGQRSLLVAMGSMMRFARNWSHGASVVEPV
jgi:alpha-ketoglutarate-dependent taurine dioxygenase